MNGDPLDGTWAEYARSSRAALALLGHPITAVCLPDEAGSCGGSFALHTVAHLATMQAIIEHQMRHLGPDFSGAFEEIRTHTAAELGLDCGADR